jgi:hypothetical protein
MRLVFPLEESGLKLFILVVLLLWVNFYCFRSTSFNSQKLRNQNTMKLKPTFIAALLASVLVVFNSCSDDDKKSSPTLFFKTDGETISFEGAKLYLVAEALIENKTIRQYTITNGIFDGDGWSLEDLRGATYTVSILLAPKPEEKFNGDFNAVNNVTMANFPDDNVAYFTMHSYWGNKFVGYKTISTELGEIISVSGGFNEDDTMTIDFNDLNIIMSHEDDNGNRVYDEIFGTLHFQSRVIDEL